MKIITDTSDDAQRFLARREIALAGVSRNPKKFGSIVFKTLKSKGFKVYPLNPNADYLDDETCYKSLHDLPDTVKNLVIVLKPADTEAVVTEAIKKGISRIWIQQGSETEAAVNKALAAGVSLISGKCILMYANPSGFHKFHMYVNKLFGKY